MSLESYRKSIEVQNERERGYLNPQSWTKRVECNEASEPEYIYIEQPHRSHTGCLIFIIVVTALLIVAAIKNPSEKESHEMVKDFVVEQLNTVLRDEMIDDDNEGIKQLGIFLGITFASSVFDYISDVKVNDYVLFTTFDCTTEVTGSVKTIVSGIIVFGKIVPLKTDLDKEKLNID